MSLAEQFLQDLDKEIGNHPDKQEILAEYELHVVELLNDMPVNETNTYEELTKRMGTPSEIAKIWHQEESVTPKKTQWLFVLLNISIFIGGILLTLSNHVFHWGWAERLWAALTDATFIIMVVYASFWGLLGYEIGKEFGYGGFKLLNKTFIVSLLPNLILMYLSVFKLLPYEWFQPFLNIPFILLCIIFTGMLYPISWIGYRWGRKISV
ncbi:HAAS signaling domain-containing protein [Oceanobacillus saliphilus]|uniref:HAAS signaling domain-containing protein n=1 Tax=Oceanobacillus saliphilus TaxID=2925834 RepID=UPI00201DB215|nr:hypothetical protein [Oceanobacillus saliphilus]